MKFGFSGINYKSADLNIRDKISFTDTAKADFLQKAEQQGIEQCMILSTCNRSEIYFFYEEEMQVKKIQDLYQSMFPDVDLSSYMMNLTGKEAVEYLYRIAAGLESLVLGEDQILGQVKDALDFSRTMGYAKKELNKVVRDAITCAKKIKTTLKISEKPLSVSYVGISKLQKLQAISGKRILVIGSGKTAVLALRYIYEYGAEKVYLCSRTTSHAKALQEEFRDLEVVAYDDRYAVLESCETLVSATASPHTILRKDRLLSMTPKVMLDLAAPRDIDTEIGEIPGMQLINLDTLQRIVADNQKEREKLVVKCRELIEEDLQETLEWMKNSFMDATIASIQQQCSEIVEDGYEYLNRKLELNQREKKILKKVLNASLQRLLKVPIYELKHLSAEQQEEYRKVVEQLFGIQREQSLRDIPDQEECL